MVSKVTIPAATACAVSKFCIPRRCPNTKMDKSWNKLARTMGLVERPKRLLNPSLNHLAVTTARLVSAHTMDKTIPYRIILASISALSSSAALNVLVVVSI